MPTPIATNYDDVTQTLEIRYDDGTSETISPVTQQHVISLLNQSGGASDAANKASVGTILTVKTKPGKTVVSKKWK